MLTTCINTGGGGGGRGSPEGPEPVTFIPRVTQRRAGEAGLKPGGDSAEGEHGEGFWLREETLDFCSHTTSSKFLCISIRPSCVCVCVCVCLLCPCAADLFPSSSLSCSSPCDLQIYLATLLQVSIYGFMYLHSGFILIKLCFFAVVSIF